MKKPEKLTQRPIYLLFLSLFPVLSLLGINIAETAPEEALRSILVSLVLGGGVLLLAYPLFRDWHRAALAAAIFLIIFFSYGHVYNLIKQIALGEMLLGRHRFLGPLGFVLLLAGWWWVKTLADPGTYSRTLNLFAALLLVYPILQISPALVQSLRTALAGQENRLEERPLVSPGDLPDIYYIIPDAYTRDDTLLDFYQYDNSPFLEELEARGFYIARCSQSNYARTYLSLSSSLNMDYVQTLSPQNDSERLTKLIKRSRVRQTLESLGYTMVAFDAGYFRTQWPDADIYVSVKDDPTRSSAGLLGFNEFETILVETTALRFLLDGNLALGGELLEFVYESGRLERYNRTQYLLDNLSAVAAAEIRFRPPAGTPRTLHLQPHRGIHPRPGGLYPRLPGPGRVYQQPAAGGRGCDPGFIGNPSDHYPAGGSRRLRNQGRFPPAAYPQRLLPARRHRAPLSRHHPGEHIPINF